MAKSGELQTTETADEQEGKSGSRTGTSGAGEGEAGAPILEDIRAYLDREQPQVLPKSPEGEAIAYTLSNPGDCAAQRFRTAKELDHAALLRTVDGLRKSGSKPTGQAAHGGVSQRRDEPQ